MDSYVSPKDEIWFLRVCHHSSTDLYYVQFGTRLCGIDTWWNDSEIDLQSSVLYDIQQETNQSKERKSWRTYRLLLSRYIYIYIYRYTRITFTKSPSICVTAFSPSLTNHEALLPRSPLAPPPRWFQQHTDLRSHEFRHSAHLWHQPRLANVTCA